MARRDDAAVDAHIGGEPQTYVSPIAPRGRARRVDMQFVTTRGGSPPVPFTTALFAGLAPDGGLYVPETIEPWPDDELARLPRRTLTEIALRALRPFTRGDLDPATLEAVVVEALNFPIPLVEVRAGRLLARAVSRADASPSRTSARASWRG